MSDPYRSHYVAPPIAVRPTESEEALSQRNARRDELAAIKAIHMGLDIGQKQDPSAVCITAVGERPSGRVEVVRGEKRPILETTYRVQHMERIDLGTAFYGVAVRVAQLVGALWDMEKRMRREGALEPDEPQLPWDLWVDVTGLGLPVFEIIRDLLESEPKTDRVKLHPVRFTFGDRFLRGAYDGESDSLGKAYLVCRMQMLFQRDLLRLPPKHREAQVMAKELKDYEIRVTENANDTYGAFKVGAHDDLVTACGLSCIEDPGMFIAQEGVSMW
jgi:hypothetical protein